MFLRFLNNTFLPYVLETSYHPGWRGHRDQLQWHEIPISNQCINDISFVLDDMDAVGLLKTFQNTAYQPPPLNR